MSNVDWDGTMKLKHWPLLTLLFVAVAGSACAVDETASPAAPETTPHALEGTWNVRALEDLNTCPDFGTMAPVSPGAVTIARDGDAWWLSQRDSATPVRYEAAGPDAWARSVDVPYEGCQFEADSDWIFDAVGETRFMSRYQASFRVFGADCGYPQDRCQVAYTVVGARR